MRNLYVVTQIYMYVLFRIRNIIQCCSPQSLLVKSWLDYVDCKSSCFLVLFYQNFLKVMAYLGRNPSFSLVGGLLFDWGVYWVRGQNLRSGFSLKVTLPTDSLITALFCCQKIIVKCEAKNPIGHPTHHP